MYQAWVSFKDENASKQQDVYVNYVTDEYNSEGEMTETENERTFEVPYWDNFICTLRFKSENPQRKEENIHGV